MIRRLRPLLILVALLVPALPVLSSCSHGGGASESAGDAAARPAGPATGTSAGTARNDPVGNSAGSSAKTDLPAAGEVIRTAQLTVAIRDKRGVAVGVAQAADAADAIATRAGGEIDSDDRTGGAHAAATLTLRVPPDAMMSVLNRLAALGTERTRSSSTTDVTERVADVTSRVSSAQASLARLRALYTRAERVSDVISIESEITDREADLESLQAQARVLARESALATVTLRLLGSTPVSRPRPEQPQAGGFTGGLRHGWHGFVAVLAWLAAAFGVLLPFLGVAAVLGATVLLWRRGALRVLRHGR